MVTLLNATTFRFDASDLMPAAVGTGSFWTGMIDYVAGKPAEQVASEIQDLMYRYFLRPSS